MRDTIAIRIADKSSLLFEGDLSDKSRLEEAIINKLEVEEDYMFSVYLQERGKFLFMAIMRFSSDKRIVNLRMAFHQGHPKHTCKSSELISCLVKMARAHMLARQLESK